MPGCKYALGGLKADKEVVLEAVKKYGYALGVCIRRFKSR